MSSQQLAGNVPRHRPPLILECRVWMEWKYSWWSPALCMLEQAAIGRRGHETETQSDKGTGVQTLHQTPARGYDLSASPFSPDWAAPYMTIPGPSVHGGFSKSLERISQLLSGGMWGFFPPVDTLQDYMCYLNYRLMVTEWRIMTSEVRETHMMGTRVRTWWIWGLY